MSIVQAWRKLPLILMSLSRARERVLRFCRSKISDEAAAEEVTQDIFVKFAEKMGNSADPIREPKAWLNRVAENACVDYRRRRLKRPKGRRPNRNLSNGPAPEKPPRQAIVLYESELRQKSEIRPDDDAELDPFSKAIDQAAMDRPNEDYSAEYEELSFPQYHLLLSQLNDRERFAFLVCGPWHLSEYDASVFLGPKLAKVVVRERRKWPTGVPIVEASRVFNIKEGKLSSQIS